jgi:hypothetical protein
MAFGQAYTMERASGMSQKKASQADHDTVSGSDHDPCLLDAVSLYEVPGRAGLPQETKLLQSTWGAAWYTCSHTGEHPARRSEHIPPMPVAAHSLTEASLVLARPGISDRSHCDARHGRLAVAKHV